MPQSILFINQNLPLPQDRKAFLLEAVTLKKTGFEVYAISPALPGQPMQEKVQGIEIFHFSQTVQNVGRLGYIWEYLHSFFWIFFLSLKVFIRKGFSVIHATNPPDFLFVIAVFFKIFRVSFVYSQHDLWPEMYLCKFNTTRDNWVYKILLWFEKLSLKTCQLHLASNQSIQREVQKRHDFSAPSVIVQNAVHIRKFSKNNIRPALFEELTKFKHLAVYLGVMGKQDGVLKLIESIKYLVWKLNRTDIGFILMGAGDEFENIKQTVAKSKLDKNIILTGWVDEQTIIPYLKNSDLGLLPEPKNDYTDNCLHNKILEYMAAGLPVISYDLKEAKLAAENAGLFIEDDNEIEFAQKIAELFDNPKKLKEMSQNALKRANNYSWHKSTNKLIDAYAKFIKHP